MPRSHPSPDPGPRRRLCGRRRGQPPSPTSSVDVNQGVLAAHAHRCPELSAERRCKGDIAAVVMHDLDRLGPVQAAGPGDLPARPPRRERPAAASRPGRPSPPRPSSTARSPWSADGRLRVDFRLWDVFSEEAAARPAVRLDAGQLRRDGAQISDAVYERLTGEPGYFDSRVVFVAESGPKTNRIRRLAIMDQDGANPSFLTDGADPGVLAEVLPNNQQITYMALRDDGSAIYLFNLENGRQETLGHFPGMVMAPRFSPDGTKVALSAEKAATPTSM